MKIKELIKQLQGLNQEQEIYIPHEYDLKEPIIQTMEFVDDTYHLLVKE